jgi:hypothetical protein
MIRRSLQQQSPPAIARELGCSVRTVRRALALFERESNRRLGKAVPYGALPSDAAADRRPGKAVPPEDPGGIVSAHWGRVVARTVEALMPRKRGRKPDPARRRSIREAIQQLWPERLWRTRSALQQALRAPRAGMRRIPRNDVKSPGGGAIPSGH